MVEVNAVGIPRAWPTMRNGSISRPGHPRAVSKLAERYPGLQTVIESDVAVASMV